MELINQIAQSEINEHTADFSLISKQSTLQEFKDINTIFRSHGNDVYTIQENE